MKISLSDRTRDQTKNVLIVDDDDDIRVALEVLLSSLGFNVNSYPTVEELIANADLSGPGCLVLDVRLPGQSGIAFQNHLLKIGCQLPIIFVSGHADIPMAVRAIQAGAVEFLTKPIRPQDLIDAIQLGLQRDSERRSRDAAGAKTIQLFEKLTPREKDVMMLIVAGHGNKQVAHLLGISEPTVKAHRGQVMRKMYVQTLPDLVRLAAEVEDLSK
ncbi:response regulator transcription factor [Rhizobium tubonense]|uniref:DNA-binding response regulator n=1 Tax=Rhizobium tubonense TaxID=484088 RepID=A0A2W4C3G8_9HYPH|nr:response regulator [Rhizobium tubonense]PZM08037.1 DNA-binding response regulator [Rhizobium tubonense]